MFYVSTRIFFYKQFYRSNSNSKKQQQPPTIITKPYPNRYEIYTDGSKSETGTGYSIYDPQNNTILKYATNVSLSIYHVELLAILRVTEYFITKNLGNTTAIIFTDSQSALHKIRCPGFADNVEIIHKIIKNINTAKIRKNLNISIMWIKGHAGIIGNTTADKNAKAAVTDGVNIEIPLFPQNTNQ